MKLASAPDKAGIEKLINEYFYSENYRLTDDNQIENRITSQRLKNFTVSAKRGRWIFANNV